LLSAIRVGLLGFVGTWAGRFLLQTETTGQAVVALAPKRARLVPSDLVGWCRHNTLAAACCSPCPWACHRRRDLSSTGSSGILITGGAFRGCLLIADRLRPACVHLVRAYRWRASGGRDTRPGGAAVANLSQRTTLVTGLRCRPQHVGRVLSHGVGRRRCRRGSNFSRQVRRQSGILAGDPGRGARMPRTMVPRHPDYGPPMAPD
jgi:hypothetical protein